jgi:DinB family protein
MSLRKALFCVSIMVLAIVPATGQSSPKTTPQQLRSYFVGVDRQVLEMAKDFPEDKYDFRLKPEMRSFGEVIVHVASGNIYADKAGRGEKVKWDELDAKNYKTKSAVVALLEKAIADSEATLKGVSDETLTKSIEPWLGVLQHSSEHYGLLVAYYRANGLVPPASRK